MISRKRVLFIILGWAICCAGVAAAEVYTDIPESVDPNRKYIFYMHGRWIEMKGLYQAHPHHGLYEYDKIVQALSNQGFVVISEVRLEDVSKDLYAQKVARQVGYLLNQGVPPENITVIGHSKGGQMTLMAAGILQNEKINFVIMAGCGRQGAAFRRGYEEFLETGARQMRGRIISIYDSDDREAGSCQEAFNIAADIQSEEVVFHTGKGHGLFYSPKLIWINEVVKWSALRRDEKGLAHKEN